MGLRFRRRLRILPGLWLNVSKSGVSTSIGGHGATLNIGKNGTQTTVGLPGSGLSYRSRRHLLGHPSNRGANGVMIALGLLFVGLILAALFFQP